MRVTMSDVRRWVRERSACDAELAGEDAKFSHDTLRRLAAAWELSLQHTVVALLSAATHAHAVPLPAPLSMKPLHCALPLQPFSPIHRS